MTNSETDSARQAGGDRLDPIAAFGDYVRSQRKLASLSLRQLADLTSLSNPYLSKLERGLHQPSVAAVTTIAKALGIPAEALLAKAAGLVPNFDGDSARSVEAVTTEQAIRQDDALTDDQKIALLSVYQNFVEGSD